MTFYERASGSRLHANYFRAGGVHQDLPNGLLEKINDFCISFPKVVDDMEKLGWKVVDAKQVKARVKSTQDEEVEIVDNYYEDDDFGGISGLTISIMIIRPKRGSMIS